jgi:hypothetical protein
MISNMKEMPRRIFGNCWHKRKCNAEDQHRPLVRQQAEREIGKRLGAAR